MCDDIAIMNAALSMRKQRAGFVGVRVLTPEEIVEANENGKKVIVQLAFYSVFTVLLSVCALYRCCCSIFSNRNYSDSLISTHLSVALGPSTYSFRQALQTSTFDSEIP